MSSTMTDAEVGVEIVHLLDGLTFVSAKDEEGNVLTESEVRERIATGSGKDHEAFLLAFVEALRTVREATE